MRVHDLSLGHPLKFLWEEKAQHLTSYPNFWKQFYRKFPELRRASVTARELSAGERIECDYAGKTLEWVDLTDGVIHQAYIFISVLGFSQLLFAWAAEDMKSRNWLSCHRRMFEAYGGVAHVTVPDCLKQGVTKCHIYDPDLNPAYAQLASHYSTAIVPARPGRPKDKGLAENAVNLVMRYVRFRYRRRRISNPEHFPANSQAYYEATPQKLLSQARFVHPELHQLLIELFNADVYGHLRRAQGLVRSSAKELDAAGRELASSRIVGAIATMRRYNEVHVPYF